MFPTHLFPVGREHVAALSVSSEQEIAALRIDDPARWARRCRYDSVALVILTHAANLPGTVPGHEAARITWLTHLSHPGTGDIDRWNTALLVLQRHYDDHHRLRLTRTALTGLGTRSTSRLMEEAELALHLRIARGELPIR